jgi:hypothetical protein
MMIVSMGTIFVMCAIGKPMKLASNAATVLYGWSMVVTAIARENAFRIRSKRPSDV